MIMRIVYFFILVLFVSDKGIAQGIYQLYGQTPYGGTENGGMIFTTNSVGANFQRRYDFRIGTNAGAEPWRTKLAEFNGKFYGMTLKGGAGNQGVIFEYDPVTNIYTKKIDFVGSNGSLPYGSLVLSGAKFYGMTSAGGSSSKGVLFEWDPASNAYTVKYNFNLNGYGPEGNVTPVGGVLYGMTRYGGTGAAGVIFQWDIASNTYTKKIDLTTANGSHPAGTLAYSNGLFYGVTVMGGNTDGGTIFQWNPTTNIYTKKYDFITVSGTGNYPVGSMTEYAGKFYGMAYDGGSGSGGVIYEWDPVANIYTKKIDLSPTTGENASGELVMSNGKFYGLTLSSNTFGGTIFEWDPATNIFVRKVDLNDVRGRAPSGTMLLSNNKMYGLTKSGGADNLGTLFEWNPATNIFIKKVDLGGKDDKFPTGTLTRFNGKLYGAATKGGINGIGVLFEWDPASATYSKKYEFSTQDGRNPNSSLTLFNQKLYGMTTFGGTQDSGVIFEWDPVSNVYTKKIDFSGSKGTVPYGDLVAYNNKLYGMTSSGNAGNTGTIFEWDPASNVFIKKIDFTGPTGYHPFGSLSLFNGKFYGTTIDGGTTFLGTLFEWDPNSNIITTKHNFTVAGGNRSYGTLTLENNIFYGVTYYGGANGAGVLFTYDPMGEVYTPKVHLAVSTGSNPQACVTFSGGKFYGITRNGGNNGRGVIFEWDPITNGYSKKYDFASFSSTLHYNNNLLRVPAFVANGVDNTCTTMPTITINSSNNNIWVPITDIKGDAIGEIRANGNNLGTVSTSLYVNNGPVREDTQHRLYLDRNVSITPQVQPSTPVDIRLYLKKSEFEALRTATNSLGQPSGVNTIAELSLFKNSDPCTGAISNSLNPVPVTAAQWGDNYVLTASISSFSSFFVTKSTALPVSLLHFSAAVLNYDALLTWVTATEQQMAGYELERSFNGIDFSQVGSRVLAYNSSTPKHYQVKDPEIFRWQTGNVYYRLKMINVDGTSKFSGIVVLSNSTITGTTLYPNPANDKIFLEDTFSGSTSFYFYNSLGVLVKSDVKRVATGRNLLVFDIGELPKGIYYLAYTNNATKSKKAFVKQ